MASQQEEIAHSAIDAAYFSYHVAVLQMEKDSASAARLRKKLAGFRQSYNSEFWIDIRQNVRPLHEDPRRTIHRACQYAQACLIRDFRRLRLATSSLRQVQERVERFLAISPRELTIDWAYTGGDVVHAQMAFLRDIHDPPSAARVIGHQVLTDWLPNMTGYHCLLDEVLDKRIREAETAVSPRTWWRFWR